MTKAFGVGFRRAFLRGCRKHGPQQASIVLASPGDEVKIHAEIVCQAKFPELVGDVLGGVGGGAVAFDEYLVAHALALVGLRVAVAKWHYPAASRRAFLWMFQNAAIAQHLEGAFPQTRANDGGFPGEQVIGDVQAYHSCQVRPHDLVREVCRELRIWLLAVFDGAHHGFAPLQQIWFLHCGKLFFTDLLAQFYLSFVGSANRDVEPRAIVIEGLTRQLIVAFGEFQQSFLQEDEGDYYVGNLHARIVDIVVGLDVVDLRTQHAHDGIAEAGVTQVSNVRGFVAVDGGMFDNHFGAYADIVPSEIGSGIQHALDHVASHDRAVQAKVDVAGCGGADLRDGRGLHVVQDGCNTMRDVHGAAVQSIFTRPGHERNGVVAKTGLRRETQIYR